MAQTLRYDGRIWRGDGSNTLRRSPPPSLTKPSIFANIDLDSFPDTPLAKYSNNVEITEWEVGDATGFCTTWWWDPTALFIASTGLTTNSTASTPTLTKSVVAGALPMVLPRRYLGILSERGRRYLHHTQRWPHSLQVGPDNKIWMTLSVGKGLASFDPVTQGV